MLSMGNEPTTFSLQEKRSTTELRKQYNYYYIANVHKRRFKLLVLLRTRIELVTSPLLRVRSNQLSYISY